MTTLTDAQLAAIAADCLAFLWLAEGMPDSTVLPEMAIRCIRHMPALLAEIERLQAVIRAIADRAETDGIFLAIDEVNRDRGE